MSQKCCRTFTPDQGPYLDAVHDALHNGAHLVRRAPERNEGSRERRLVIGYKQGGTSKFFSALSNLYHFYSLYSARKYVEQFANGVTIISIYLNPLPGGSAPPIEHSIHQVMKEASLLYCLPDNPFFYASGDTSTHAVQEATYACECMRIYSFE